jgi:CYTH domain-containing protein
MVEEAVATHLFKSPRMRVAALNKEREARLDLTAVPADALENVVPSEIEQGILVESEDRDTMVRVRKESAPGGTVRYTITAKHYPSFSEAETVISPDIFEGLRGLVMDIERKKRYRWNGWDIDDIETGRRGGRVVAEFEFPEGTTNMIIPDEIRSLMTGEQ